jgi:maltokinase
LMMEQALPVTRYLNRQELGSGLRNRFVKAASKVPELGEYSDVIAARYEQLEDYLQSRPPVRLQRIHGDLHLGQTLYQAPSFKWWIIDFEGEPLRPAMQRIFPDLPERDVAGVIRSFGYAHSLGSSESGGFLDGGMESWQAEATAAFLEGYRAIRSIDELILEALILDKAIYETLYEATYRPEWQEVPMAAVRELLPAKYG